MTIGLTTPEEAKRRVWALDAEMHRTEVLMERGYQVAHKITDAQIRDWRHTMRQWNVFVADITTRNDWAMFDYGDAEATCRAFENKAREARALLGAAPIIDPGKEQERIDAQAGKTLGSVVDLLKWGIGGYLAIRLVSALSGQKK
jgi:hypothetical protein